MIKVDKELFFEIYSTNKQLEKLGIKLDTCHTINKNTDLIAFIHPHTFNCYIMEYNGESIEQIQEEALNENESEPTEYETNFLIDFYKWKKEKKVRTYKVKKVGEWQYRFDGVNTIEIFHPSYQPIICYKDEFKEFYKTKIKKTRTMTPKDSSQSAAQSEEVYIAKLVGLTFESLTLYFLRKFNDVHQGGTKS